MQRNACSEAFPAVPQDAEQKRAPFYFARQPFSILTADHILVFPNMQHRFFELTLPVKT